MIAGFLVAKTQKFEDIPKILVNSMRLRQPSQEFLSDILLSTQKVGESR